MSRSGCAQYIVCMDASTYDFTICGFPVNGIPANVPVACYACAYYIHCIPPPAPPCVTESWKVPTDVP